MNTVETAKVLAVLKATYPNFYRNMEDDEIDGIISIWAEMFADEPYALVIAAVKALLAGDEKGFPPHIGAVKARIHQITTPNRMTDGEAWALVSRAISRSAYNSVQEFDKLPSELQRIVGSANQLRDWSQMDADTVQSVVASNLQRAFRARQQADREYAMLPPDVRTMMDTGAERRALEHG